MKIYTKTGDQGETGLFGGPRVPKDHPRIEAYGSVDELAAALGLAAAEPLPDDVRTLLVGVQNDLFRVGAELASPQPQRMQRVAIAADCVTRLEQAIDRFEAELAPLSQFILPGGTRAAALMHLARVASRRAERRVVTLARTAGEQIPGLTLVYLNRLSDLLFVLARVMNARAGVPDIPWEKPAE